MNRILVFMRSLSKQKKVTLFIAISLTILFVLQLTVFAWFGKRREAARLERINSPNLLFITAAHREDSINLVMDDITVDGKWDENNPMTYQDYVFSVAGEYVESFTLQLAHTKNNPFTYEIFEAEVTKATPTSGELEGRDYVTYTATNEYPADLVSMPDNKINGETVTISDGDILYYRPRKLSAEINGETVNLPVTLNGTVQTENNIPMEINSYTYEVGTSTATVNYDGHYLNMGNDGLATDSLDPYTYDGYDYKDQRVQPLYWQCSTVPGSDVSNKSAFYHEYILRVYFNSATATYKDTDIIYITALGNG